MAAAHFPRSDPELTVEVNRIDPNSKAEKVREVLDILRFIYSDQNEHNYQKFSEAYMKV